MNLQFQRRVLRRLLRPGFALVLALRISIGVAAPPANDNFADAAVIPSNFTNVSVIPGIAGLYQGDNGNATSEPGEPRHTWRGDGKSVWWKWTAPENGTLALDMQLSYVPAVAVYRGESLSTLELLAENPAAGFYFPSSIFQIGGMRRGETYHLAFDGWAGSSGPFHFGLLRFPAPTNDDFEDALVISGLPAETGPTSLLNATREPGEPLHPGSPDGGTGWWKWTSPITGWIAISNRAAIYPLVAVYSGNALENLQLISGGIAPNQDVTPARVEAGKTYSFAVGAMNINLQLSEAAAPANNDFAGAIPLNSYLATADGDNTFADTEPLEPSYRTNSSARTLWWKWTAPSSGELELVRGYEFTPLRTEATIFTGTSLADLHYVGHTTNMQWDSVYLPVNGGTTHYLALDTMEKSYGPFRWQFQLRATPSNDLFAARQSLAVPATLPQVPLGTAGREPGEPSLLNGDTIGKTLWWTFTPPLDGTMNFSAAALGAHVQVAIGVFTGTSLSTLTPVSEALDTTGSLRVQSNEVYHIVTDPVALSDPYWGGHVREMNVDFRYEALPGNDSFASRIQLDGVSVVVTNRNVGATRERGEPRHTSTPTLGASLWYSWTAPAGGWVYLSARGEYFSPMVAVYEGRSIRKLKRVRTTPPVSSYYTTTVGFEAVAGRAYQIAVDGLADENLTGNIELSLQFSTLRMTSPGPGSAHASAAPLLLAVGAPNPAIEGTLTGVGYLLAHEYHGPQPIISGDALSFSVQTTNLIPGRYAAVAIATNSTGTVFETPPVQFRVTPPGDAFALRIPVTGYQWHVAGKIAGATLEPKEPRAAGGADGSVWYTWTAPASGLVNLFPQLPQDVSLTVYRGSKLTKLKRLSLGTIDGWIRTFKAVAGTEYCFAFTHSSRPGAEYAEGFSLDLALGAVHLASPQPLTRYTDDDVIPLQISLVGSEAQVGSVDYLAGDVVIASTATPPFQATWARVRPGDYPVRARVRMTSGLEALSPPVLMRVELANDHFVNRKLLSGLTVTTNASLYGATFEPGEPGASGFYTSTRSAWWTWVAPKSGRVWVDYIGTPPLATMAVYTGTALDNLKLVEGRYRDTIAGLEIVAQAGTAYHIRVSHNAEGEGQLKLRLWEPPANDLFSGRFMVAGTNAVLESHTMEAARQPGEPLIPYGCGYAGRLIWWSWTAPGDGSVSVAHPFTNGFCVRIGVYTGNDLGSLVLLSSHDSHDSAALDVVAGQVYQITIDTSIEFERLIAFLTFKPRPANDNFANRTPLTGSAIEFEADTVGATLEAGEPAHSGIFEPASVWYSWTAPFSGKARFDTLIGPGYGVVEAYRGSSLAALENMNVGWNPQEFNAEQGVTYQLAVGPYLGGPSFLPIRIRLELVSTNSPTAFAASASRPEPLHLRVSPGPSIEVHGPVGERFLLEASSDFITWIPLAQAQLGRTSFQFSDTQNAHHSMRFYRAVKLP